MGCGIRFGGDTVDEAAFTSLIDSHARVIASAIRRVCSRRHRSLIPDVEQEVRTALWKRLQGGKEIEHPVSYLYKVALTAALAVVRRQDREEPALPPDTEPAGVTSASYSGLLPAEQSCLLAEALERLPSEESRAIRAYLAGFNHVEVAALYGWTSSVARHRIYRGLESLRGILKGSAA
jgi:RNA polymerase sigma factor (sigma-70 family)